MKLFAYSLLLLSFLFLPVYCEEFSMAKIRKETKERKKFDKAFEIYAKDLCKRNKTQFIQTGIGTLLDVDHTLWSIHMVDRRGLTQQEARPIAVHMFDEFWNKISNDPSFLNNMLTSYIQNCPTKVDPTMVGIKWAFWDANVDRYDPPQLAEIRIYDQNIYYFYANPKTQALEEPIVETIDEARRKI